ncbi:MAG: phosphoglucosamine mutase, partial [Defluviitaleaceae bacterium]|nr:phosphoglucosamine mutase [Defluviitaleaceae bacterium]
MGLFGTDGVRGLANTAITGTLAYNLGQAGAAVLTKNKANPAILIATDTRHSAFMLEAALAAGICAAGADVIMAGIMPSPAVAHFVRKYNLAAGAMISASHNPFADNGIKFFDTNGYKLSDKLENEIENIYTNELQNLPIPTGDKIGRKRATDADFTAEYVDYLCGTIQTDLSGLKIALDCANGAAYLAAAPLFTRLGADVGIINAAPNGQNINDSCGSTHLGGLADFVKSGKYHMGFAFDGDADRCLAIDENGEILDGDKIMAIMATHLRDNGKLANNTIVTTIMSNQGFFNMAKTQGLTAISADVGDRYVLEQMLSGGHNFGGEQSGHLIFLDHATTGDGLLTALQLAAAAKAQSRPLSQLGAIMQPLPQVLENAKIPNDKKQTILDHPEITAAINALESRYAADGRILIR